ncbi:DUF6234 family protein [Streptomyces eurythermus]
MTGTPAPGRRHPWSHRTRPGVDLAFAVPLSLWETAWLVPNPVYGYGLDVWAAQGAREHIDAAGLAYMRRLRALLITALVLAVLAAISRARWTVVTHLLVALLAGGALTAARHDRDRSHAPPPGCVRYSAHC